MPITPVLSGGRNRLVVSGISGSIKMMPRKYKTAFTLIELLVVIAIIALLVSILLPSLQNAKELARRVSCQSQMRAISTAVSLYSAENDGYLFTTSNTSGVPQEVNWMYAIRPYFGITEPISSSATGEEYLHCPSHEIPATWNPWQWFYSSFAANAEPNAFNRCYNYGGNYYENRNNISNIVNPAEVMMYVETGGDMMPIAHTLILYSIQYYGVDGIIADRHGGGLNEIFFDGHVAYRKRADFPQLDVSELYWGGE